MANIIFSESSGLCDSIYGKSQAPIRLFLEKKGEAFENESQLKNLFYTQDSDHFGEKFTYLTSMEGFRAVGENGAYPIDESQEGFAKFFEHTTFKNSFAISREMIEDSKTIDLKKKPAAFIQSYYRTKEKLGAALFGNALMENEKFTFADKEFDATCADGLPLFSKGHKGVKTADVQCNIFSDTFSEDSLGAIESAMQNFRGDSGELLDIAPDTILIPNVHSLKKQVFAAIGADKDPSGSGNGFNYHFGRWNVIVWNYLNDYVRDGDMPFILIDSRYNSDNAGAVWLDRTPLEVRSTVDENTDANIWRGYARFSAGFNDWRFAAAGGMQSGSSILE